MAEVKRPPQQQTLPERKHGILYNLLWGWPWALVGVVLSSLLLSLLIEYIGIAFFWPEAGAAHSEVVMNTELGWLGPLENPACAGLPGGIPAAAAAHQCGQCAFYRAV